MVQTKPTSVRLSADAKGLQRLLSQHLGVSQHAVLELAIRMLAEQKGIKLKEKMNAITPTNGTATLTGEKGGAA